MTNKKPTFYELVWYLLTDDGDVNIQILPRTITRCPGRRDGLLSIRQSRVASV
jgi:hypothetical protein